jgi:hypothetical protein
MAFSKPSGVDGLWRYPLWLSLHFCGPFPRADEGILVAGGITNDQFTDPRPSLLPSNYALERSVKDCGWRAAGARRDFSPAARRNDLARPAQRGR